MKYIETNWDVPYYNFALEDYLLNKADEGDYVFFYIHKPSIIVGKYQNTIEEVNKDFIEENNITVARRLSGGGAVYHDHGNLNFSFVHKASKSDMNNFKKFTKPVVDALKELGLNAHLSGRNDILIDDKKISGNAQYYTNGRLLHHGTLLYDSQMSNLVKSLKVRDLKIKSKGIKSVKSRVANISDFLNNKLPIEDFKDYLLKSFYQSRDIEKHDLDEEAMNYIEKKVKEQFSTWDWNWGKSPNFEIQKIDKFPFGILDTRLDIKDGLISHCKIYGDYFSKKDIVHLENSLIGLKYDKSELLKNEDVLNINEYFDDIEFNDYVDYLV
ncbi:MAG: lipoate--protein ligase [Bacillota bacterium]|nr:lipoate--protein ligase [Bacillota bacterium]